MGTPIDWPHQIIPDVYQPAAANSAKVWAWTRLSPCWRSLEASLSWICFLPAQMLRMRWHVRVCVTAAGPRTSVSCFKFVSFERDVLVFWLQNRLDISKWEKTKPFAFHYGKCEKMCLKPHQTIRMTGLSWSWHAGSKRCFKQQCACAACLNILRIAKQVASMKKEFKTEAWPQRKYFFFLII